MTPICFTVYSQKKSCLQSTFACNCRKASLDRIYIAWLYRPRSSQQMLTWIDHKILLTMNHHRAKLVEANDDVMGFLWMCCVTIKHLFRECVWRPANWNGPSANSVDHRLQRTGNSWPSFSNCTLCVLYKNRLTLMTMTSCWSLTTEMAPLWSIWRRDALAALRQRQRGKHSEASLYHSIQHNCIEKSSLTSWFAWLHDTKLKLMLLSGSFVVFINATFIRNRHS